MCIYARLQQSVADETATFICRVHGHIFIPMNSTNPSAMTNVNVSVDTDHYNRKH